MASSSKNVPPNGNQPARSTITAIRIPPDDDILPYMTTLELVKSTSDYHSSLYDFNLLHHSNSDDMRDTRRRSSSILDPMADDTLIDVDQLYDSMASLREKARWTLPELELDPRLNSHSYGNGYGILLDVPLAKRTAKPHMTFTHASLRYQPNVVDQFWKSGEAWRKRAFKRLFVVPREEAELEFMTGEYHIMYTLAVGQSYLPNEYARHRIFGDAFVLKMASEKNEEGDWYYEDVPQEILHCSLGNQCLEALRCLRPINYKTMVGERGNGPPGVISSGTGLKGMIAPICVA